ncbi:hypothetical protein GmHk_06G016901 [Glycine max]|nr:hypothetical protein GmHk_06G016901 [Glycine max]
MASPKNYVTPSHVLYANDLMDNKLKSSQLKDVALSAIHSCKQLRFQNSIVSLNNAMDLLVCTIALTGNHTKGVMKNSINKFTILKRLQITTHFAKAPSIFLVVWYPLLCHWIKCNIDSAPKGNPSFVACCGLFCNSVILALELVASKGWSHVWLETDLTLVVAAFKNASLVTWNIVNRWKNYVNILFDRNFRASHIYREGNECADWLANHDTILTNFCGYNG